MYLLILFARNIFRQVGEKCTQAQDGSDSFKQQALSIMRINLPHCKAPMVEPLLSLTKAEVGIALIREPYIYKNKVTWLGSERYITLAKIR